MYRSKLSYVGLLLLMTVSLIQSQLLAQDDKKIQITHKQAIAKLKHFGDAEYKVGQQLFNQVCYACHGNLEQPPSVPTARLFYKDKLVKGSDPYTLFQTLTTGFNQMPPQPWMSSEQKYYMIHYLRETYFKKHNPSQYTAIDDAYLSKLPSETIPWPAVDKKPKLEKQPDFDQVDFGPAMFGHFEASLTNIAPKGLIINIDPNKNDKQASVSASEYQALYDIATGRMAAINHGDVLDWNDLNYKGGHRIHAKMQGERIYETPMLMAWAVPQTPATARYPDFRDPRPEALNGYKYGPLPKDRYTYHGLFMPNEDNGLTNPALSYSVGETHILEMPSMHQFKNKTFIMRTFVIDPHDQTLNMRLHGKVSAQGMPFKIIGEADLSQRGRINEGLLIFHPSDEREVIHVLLGEHKNDFKNFKSGSLPKIDWDKIKAVKRRNPKSLDFAGADLTDANKKKQAVTMVSNYMDGDKDTAYQVDEIVLPQNFGNPWKTRIRLAGIDFLTDDRAVVASWVGDIFLIDGMLGQHPGKQVKITRIASGLHQPLGLKVQKGQIYVSCRDQIVRLHDLNGDLVTDFYEAFNSDHVVSMHFHEFAGGLATDAKGNFYYVKSAQHADPAFFPQHGTLQRVSPDGLTSTTLATGLRSVNGCYVEPDGTAWLTDQEGFWNPQNKVMRAKVGGFHGNMLAWYDPKKITEDDNDMVHPIVWIPKVFGNSPSEMFHFPKQGWGALSGKLGYLDYGKARVMIIPYEELGDRDPLKDKKHAGMPLQGLTHPLPIPRFETGIMRSRFHPKDHSMYLCGLFGWGSGSKQWGGMYRVRPTGKPAYCVVAFHAEEEKLVLTLSDPILGEKLEEQDFEITSFFIERAASYGSKLNDETKLEVEHVKVDCDNMTLELTIPDLEPTRVLDIKVNLPTRENPDGTQHHWSGTIHALE